MVEATQAFAIDRALAVEHAARLSIVVEELVYNLVDHGGLDDASLIELTLTHEDAVVSISLSDSGVPFDPRDAPTDEEIPDRGGGAGIDLVLAWTEIVDYRSEAGRNRLQLRMRLS